MNGGGGLHTPGISLSGEVFRSVAPRGSIRRLAQYDARCPIHLTGDAHA